MAVRRLAEIWASDRFGRSVLGSPTSDFPPPGGPVPPPTQLSAINPHPVPRPPADSPIVRLTTNDAPISAFCFRDFYFRSASLLSLSCSVLFQSPRASLARLCRGAGASLFFEQQARHAEQAAIDAKRAILLVEPNPLIKVQPANERRDCSSSLHPNTADKSCWCWWR